MVMVRTDPFAIYLSILNSILTKKIYATVEEISAEGVLMNVGQA